MSCDRLAGNDYVTPRLTFDDAGTAELDDCNMQLGTPDTSGVFAVTLRDRQTGNVLGDEISDNRCMRQGQRSRMVFTRRHANGNVTTRYEASVIPIADTTRVMLRGRFSRATRNATTGAVSITSGDYETEKPT